MTDGKNLMSDKEENVGVCTYIDRKWCESFSALPGKKSFSSKPVRKLGLMVPSELTTWPSSRTVNEALLFLVLPRSMVLAMLRFLCARV